MSLWKTLKNHAGAQFLDVLQWLDDSGELLVYRYPIFNQALQDGGKLVVRPGQAAVFVNEGQLSESFGPGTFGALPVLYATNFRDFCRRASRATSLFWE